MSNPTGTQAVDRAARLLREVIDAAEPVTFTELVTATGLPKSTTSRLLVALERSRLVRRDAAGAYGPGEVFVSFAWRHSGEADLVGVAQRYLERLGDKTGETVNLGVVRRSMVEQIAQVDSRYMLGGTNWLGRPVPLHCTAIGKVLLANGAAVLPAGRLERCGPRTITSRAELAANLDEVRRRGYAVTDEELEPGLVAVAAPIHKDGGAVVAALSVTGPSTRLGTARRGEVAGHAIAEANELSAELGYRPQRDRPQREGAA